MVSKTFILAGDAIFTIQPPKGFTLVCGGKEIETKEWYSFRIQHVAKNDRWPESWFVKILAGPDNTRDYKYLGKLDDFTGQLKLTAKSAYGPQSAPVLFFNKVMARVWTGDLAIIKAAGWKVHHEGKCGRCARRLTTPQSIERGIGPDCAEQMGLITPAQAKREAKEKKKAEPFDLAAAIAKAAQADRSKGNYTGD